MNQNIKFRAWDDKEKRMLYPDPLSSSWGTKDSKGNISNIPAIMTWDGNVYLCVEENKYKLQSQIQLLQFVKTQDCNGKDIYQGDIIRVKSWNGGDFGADGPDDFIWVYRIVHNVIITDKISKMEDAEVIGNIYENPDLALKHKIT